MKSLNKQLVVLGITLVFCMSFLADAWSAPILHVMKLGVIDAAAEVRDEAWVSSIFEEDVNTNNGIFIPTSELSEYFNTHISAPPIQGCISLDGNPCSPPLGFPPLGGFCPEGECNGPPGGGEEPPYGGGDPPPPGEEPPPT